MGLLQPLVVRSKINYFEIIAGHRRFEACKSLGWSKVMCHIVEVDDKEAYEISLTENLQQKTLNPMEEARAFKEYTTTFGWGGESHLAIRISKSQEYVSRRIKLLSLPNEIQDKIMRRQITVSLSQELFGLEEDAIGEVVNYASKSKLNAKDVRNLANRIKKKELQIQEILSSQQDDNLPYTQEIESYDLQGNEERFTKISTIIFKKAIVTTRLSLKNTDSLIEDLDDYEKEEEGNSKRNTECIWILKETIMHHRLQLHRQLDVLIKEQVKLKRILKAEKRIAGR